MRQLTWADLLIQDLTPAQFSAWIEPWRQRIGGQVSPLFLNMFGQWFLRRPEGHVDFFDVFSGQLKTIAPTHETFAGCVNDGGWQEEYLLSKVVFMRHEAGKVPTAGECYALAPHLHFGGPNPSKGENIDPRFVLTMDVTIWQSLCAQALQYPPGYKPTRFAYEEDL